MLVEGLPPHKITPTTHLMGNVGLLPHPHVRGVYLREANSPLCEAF